MLESPPATNALPSPWTARPGTCDLLLLQAPAEGTLAPSLERAGIHLDYAYSREGACSMARQHRYTIILVLGQPASGLLGALRKAVGDGIAAPLLIVLLAGRATTAERLAHYAQGADLCLDDWTDVEVVTRIRAWERRRYGTIPRSWLSETDGPRLHVAPNGFIFLGNLRLTLSPMQRAILATIILAGDEGVRPACLCRQLVSRSLTYGAIRVHVCSIRKVLLSYPNAPRLHSHAGHYRIEPPVVATATIAAAPPM